MRAPDVRGLPMNIPLLASAGITLVLALAPAATPVEASTAIQRCQSADGTLVYTDKACAAFGARATPMSGELLTRIASEESRFADPQTPDDGSLYPDASAPLADALPNVSKSSPSARRWPAGGCARTPTQLQMDLRGSLALGDVNRLAESYHWVGMSSRQGERVLDRLQHLIGRQVVDSHYFDAQISDATPGGSMYPDAGSLVATAYDGGGVGGDAGVLQVVLGDDSARSVVDFDVHKYAGCYFVKF